MQKNPDSIGEFRIYMCRVVVFVNSSAARRTAAILCPGLGCSEQNGGRFIRQVRLTTRVNWFSLCSRLQFFFSSCDASHLSVNKTRKKNNGVCCLAGWFVLLTNI